MLIWINIIIVQDIIFQVWIDFQFINFQSEKKALPLALLLYEGGRIMAVFSSEN